MPRIAVVVQRYGADISGGAELHARYVAEGLAAHADVEVLTTCARDYLTWRNEFPPGPDEVHGIRVHRFPVAHERKIQEFARHSARVFEQPHSWRDELAWLDAEGPACPSLLAHLRRRLASYEFVVCFSVRYYQACHAARIAADRAVLVPTAEREPSVALAVVGAIFRGVRAIMYNSPEEQAMITAASANTHVPGAVVGIGSKLPTDVDAERARRRFGLLRPFIVYVGRIDANKGCAELFDFFLQYLERSRRALDLVLIGAPVLPIPQHPHIRHLGYVTDAEKFDTIAAASVLVMPSYFESLSMVALEAWALGRPVLANARCDVLLGQCLRSNAGLYYENAREFAAALDTLLDNPPLAAAMGDNGRAFYAAHYAWPVIERKYLDMFARLRVDPPRHAMEPLPGIFARRRRTIPPATAALAALPSGPVAPRARAGGISS